MPQPSQDAAGITPGGGTVRLPWPIGAPRSIAGIPVPVLLPGARMLHGHHGTYPAKRAQGGALTRTRPSHMGLVAHRPRQTGLVAHAPQTGSPGIWGLWHTCPSRRGSWHTSPNPGAPGFGACGPQAPVGGAGGAHEPHAAGPDVWGRDAQAPGRRGRDAQDPVGGAGGTRTQSGAPAFGARGAQAPQDRVAGASLSAFPNYVPASN